MADNALDSAAPDKANPQSPAHAEGMPHEGLNALTSEHGGTGAEHHADPASFGLINGTAWVSIAMLVFIGILIWKKVPALITRGLDKQIAAIRERLDEAKTLRAEAEALRAEYARKLATIEQQSADMIAQAETDAAALREKAEADAAELIERRTRMAQDKIAAAERAAVEEVRARAATAAAAAAERLIQERLDANADRALVDQAIGALGRPH